MSIDKSEFVYDYDDYLENDLDDEFCYTCGNEGVVIVCCDDICRGLGYCIHGDGEEGCSDCGGGY